MKIELTDDYEEIRLKVLEDDTISLTISPYALWNAMSDETKEEVLQDRARWEVVKAALKYDLGRSLSTPNFNSTLFKLRKLIVSDNEFVNDITVSFIKQILEEWAKAEQYKREANNAFYKLYHSLDFESKRGRPSPYSVNKDDDYMRMSTKEVHQEIMDNFSALLKEQTDE